MVSKKTLIAYEFETIQDYFEYIIQSKTVGQPQQVKTLILKLSKDQKKEFLIWINDEIEQHLLSLTLDDRIYCRQILIENF